MSNGVRQLQKVASKVNLNFVFAPLLFFLIPLKVSLSVVIGAVVLGLVGQAAFSRFNEDLQELLRKYFALERGKYYTGFLDFIQHMKPFVLWGMFLYAPLAPIMMLVGCLQRCTVKKLEETETLRLQDNSLVSVRIPQNLPKYKREHCENFMDSSFFSATTLMVFLSGLPAAATFAVYILTGADAAFGYPSRSPDFARVFIFILLYIYSVSWCLTTLFFKAYFTFPLSYMSTESTVTLDRNGIHTSHVKGWFSQAMIFTDPSLWPTELTWESVRSVEYHQQGTGRMAPLPDLSLPGGARSLIFLNRFATLSDALVEKFKPARYIIVSEYGSHEERSGKSVRINLWELDTSARETLYRAIKKWAPDAVVSEAAHFHLTGRKIEPNLNSELWFDNLLADHGGQSLTLLEPGQVLRSGQIQILRFLETSGQANYYEALHKDGTVSVLKEYILAGSNGFHNVLDSASEFENECRILSQLSHPNIPGYRGMFVDEKRGYLIQQKVVGDSLRTLVASNGKMMISKVVELALQMCGLLEYLHSFALPIIHQNFNPDNLMVSENGELYLRDFGIARQSLNLRGAPCGGRKEYCAPEQFRGQATSQSDLYAFGATLYFLLIGDDPPAISTLSLRSRDSQISLDLESIVARSTALEPEARYESAKWIKLELQEIRVGS